VNNITPRDHAKDAEEERRKPQARIPSNVLCRPLREPERVNVQREREAAESGKHA